MSPVSLYMSVSWASLGKLVLAVLVAAIVRVLYLIYDTFIAKVRTNPINVLPGLSGTRFENHHLQFLNARGTMTLHAKLQKEFGLSFRYQGMGWHDMRFVTFDYRAATHIFQSPNYERPWQTRDILRSYFQDGIFCSTGHVHKLQRRVIAPAFASAAVRDLEPIFVKEAGMLCDRIHEVLSAEKEEAPVIDIAKWISRASFNTMARAALDYDFQALSDTPDEVYTAVMRLVETVGKGMTNRDGIEIYLPFLRWIFPSKKSLIAAECHRTITKTGLKVVEDKKERLGGDISEPISKDMITLLIQANMSEDPSKRMGDQEILDQISTFLIIGADTVSLTLTWALHRLSHCPEIQSRLRKEIHTFLADGGDSSDSGFAGDRKERTLRDVIDQLPYLEAVVQEVLRMHPAVHSTIRVASADDHVPISAPVQLRDGRVLQPGDTIHIRKGTMVHLPIEGLNTAEAIWGEDAMQFKPERWEKIHKGDRRHIAKTSTFTQGPYGCIGLRFSSSNLKVFLAALILRFEFTPQEGIIILKENFLTVKPSVKGRYSEGTQLPIHVREVR